MALGQRPSTGLLKIYIMVRITFLMEGVHTCTLYLARCLFLVCRWQRRLKDRYFDLGVKRQMYLKSLSECQKVWTDYVSNPFAKVNIRLKKTTLARKEYIDVRFTLAFKGKVNNVLGRNNL